MFDRSTAIIHNKIKLQRIEHRPCETGGWNENLLTVLIHEQQCTA